MIIKADFKKSLPVFTQLDVWSVLISLLLPEKLKDNYRKDTWEILYKIHLNPIQFFSEE